MNRSGGNYSPGAKKGKEDRSLFSARCPMTVSDLEEVARSHEEADEKLLRGLEHDVGVQGDLIGQLELEAAAHRHKKTGLGAMMVDLVNMEIDEADPGLAVRPHDVGISQLGGIFDLAA